MKTATIYTIIPAGAWRESKPEECHRSRLIGTTLEEENISVLYIDESGQIKTQHQIAKKYVKDRHS